MLAWLGGIAARRWRCWLNSWIGSSWTCRSGNDARCKCRSQKSEVRSQNRQPASSNRHWHWTRQSRRLAHAASRCRRFEFRWRNPSGAYCARRFMRRKICRRATVPRAMATRFWRATLPNIFRSLIRFTPPTGSRANFRPAKPCAWRRARCCRATVCAWSCRKM